MKQQETNHCSSVVLALIHVCVCFCMAAEGQPLERIKDILAKNTNAK
jgi:hypothetical protein